MKWPTVRLSEMFRVKHGYAFKSRYFDSDGPYVLLTPGSFHEEGGYRDQGERQKFYTGDVPDGFILEEGDLLVAMTEQAPGLLGSSAWIPASNRFLHNQRLGRIVDLDERLDKRFLYYLFNTREVRHQISASATGTKVRHTAPERIGQVVVSLPPHRVQCRIAETLCAYDDLIENNRRRMALLEEAARQLYREWFVRLRFPGREHTRVVDGVPEGWERKKLGEVLTLKRGYDLPEADRIPGEIPIVSSSGITGSHNAKRADAPGVVTGRYGTLGEVYFVDRDYWPLNTALYVSDFKGNPAAFIAHFLRHVLQSIQSDKAAVPGLNRNVAHSLGVLWPAKRLGDQFNDFAQVTFRQVGLLAVANEKLRAARDLLLPRLMSGEIAV